MNNGCSTSSNPQSQQVWEWEPHEPLQPGHRLWTVSHVAQGDFVSWPHDGCDAPQPCGGGTSFGFCQDFYQEVIGWHCDMPIAN